MSLYGALNSDLLKRAVIGWSVSPQIPMSKSQPSGPQNVTVLREEVFKGVIKLNEATRVGSQWPCKQEKAAICKPRREAAGGNKPARTLILDF